jgi:hypothetical protein
MSSRQVVLDEYMYFATESCGFTTDPENWAFLVFVGFTCVLLMILLFYTMHTVLQSPKVVDSPLKA